MKRTPVRFFLHVDRNGASRMSNFFTQKFPLEN
jgi:hypothetical protein